MTALEVRQTNQALLDAAARLVNELDEVPAGAVLRCFSRAVRTARQEGCPVTQLPVEAERLARELLAQRVLHVPVLRSG
jgi:hypothetical protein